jgi:hypothetical protein
VLDDLAASQELAEGSQGGGIAQHRAGRVLQRSLEKCQEILERLAIQAERIGSQCLAGQLFAEGPLPPAQEDRDILGIALDSFVGLLDLLKGGYVGGNNLLGQMVLQ